MGTMRAKMEVSNVEEFNNGPNGTKSSERLTFTGTLESAADYIVLEGFTIEALAG